jgi:uncharacterized protein (DUF1778 family)
MTQETKQKHLTFRVAASFLQRLDEAAQKEGATRTEYVLKVLAERLKKKDVKP